MARQDLSNEQQKTRTLIRPGYFNVWAYSSAENAVKRLTTLMHSNPLVAFFEPVTITLGPVSGGSTFYSAPNSPSTSAPKTDSSLLPNVKTLGINDPLGGLSLEEEDLLTLALDMLLDEPEGMRARMQICVDEEDARAVLPVWKNQYVLPVMADVSKQPYQLLFPVPVYTAKGKPWEGLPDLQAKFEKLLEKYRQESSKQPSQS